jgi:hypothetical protein
MKTALQLAAAIALLLVPACGGGSPPAEQQTPAEVDWAADAPHLTISVVDSIGMELGDSNYVFGQIAGAAYSPDGSIAVLDLKQSAALFYSPDGSFLRRIGRQGSGPGEFLMPSGIAFNPDSSMDVSDAMARRINFFDASGAYTGCLEGFFPTAPVTIAALDSAVIVGMKPEFEQTDEGMSTGFSLARWEGATEPTVTYFSQMAPFDPANLMASYGESIFTFAASQATGRVFRAPMTSEGYTIECYEPDGTLYLTIEKPYTPIPKSQAEIDEERTMVEERMTASGAPPEMVNWEPKPDKEAIAGLFVDGQDRLWVRRGWMDAPTFDVFDSTGTLRFVATVEYNADAARYWQVSVDGGGILAFSADPGDYPKLYLLQLQE